MTRILCEYCGSEGRIYRGQYEDERDCGECRGCGRGVCNHGARIQPRRCPGSARAVGENQRPFLSCRFSLFPPFGIANMRASSG